MLSLLRRVARADLSVYGTWIDPETIRVISAESPALIGTHVRLSRQWLEEHDNAVLHYEDPAALLSSHMLLTLPSPPVAAAIMTLDPSRDEPKGARTSSPIVLILVWCNSSGVPDASRDDTPSRQPVRTAESSTRAPTARDTERLAAFVNVLPQGVVFVDELRIESMVNLAAARWLGLSAGVLPSAIVADALRALLERVRPTDEHRADVAIIANGVDITLHNRVWELTDPPGVVLRVACVPVRGALESGRLWTFEDITLDRGMQIEVSQNRELELKLRRAQKLEAVGRLAAGLAHDFNNLLTVIGGSAEALADANLSESHRADLHDIGIATSRARQLTRQLLTFTSQQVEQPRVLEIDRHLRELSPLLAKILAPGCRLKLSTQAPDVRILADPRSVELAVLNLLANARDAMEQGGTATLRTEARSLHDAVVHGSAVPLNGPHLAIVVQDRGSGMSAQTLNHVFEPFFTTKAEGHGTGLGLATVMAIAQRAGGGVTIESVEGDGACVTMLFPRVFAPVGRVVESVQSPTNSVTRAREIHLLLVDDDAGPRRAVQRMLEHEGFQVVTASSGREALHLLEISAVPYDLLITDFVMPSMSGRELVEAARLQWPTLPVILISGFAPDGATEEILGASAVSFLAKPFSTAEIVSVIAQQLGPSLFPSQPCAYLSGLYR